MRHERETHPIIAVGSDARSVLRGVLWSYGAQVAGLISQFLYAAVTSRVLDDQDFGRYGIALSAYGLVAIVANGGLVYAVGRLSTLDPRAIGGLNAYAALAGVLIAVAFASLSLPLSYVWGDSAASTPMLVLSAALLVTPLLCVVSGGAFKMGLFRQAAIVGLVSSIVGLCVALLAIYIVPSAADLAAAPVATQLLQLAGMHLVTRGRLLHFGRFSHALEHVQYSWRVTGSNTLSYFSGTITRWAVSVQLGSAVLGQWTRAEALTTTPFYAVQSSLSQVLFPKISAIRDRPVRAYEVWTDLFLLMAWVSMPAGAVLAAVVGPLVSVFFGAGWQLAAAIAPWLAAIAGLQPIVGITNSAFVSIGKARWLYASEAFVLLAQIGVCAALFVHAAVLIAVFGVLFTCIVQHSSQIAFLGRAGYIRVSRLIRGYATITGVSVIAYLLVRLPMWAAEVYSVGNQYLIAVLAIEAGIIGIAGWATRRSLPPFRTLVKYGLFKSTRTQVV